MPQFKYTAKTMDSKTITGTIRANDKEDLFQKLKERREFLVKCEEISEVDNSGYKFNAKNISDFCREVASMTNAGITMIKSLGIMKERDIKPKIKAVYERLYKLVAEGNTLSAAMQLCGRTFPNLLVNMFRASEASGQIEETAVEMADYYEKQHRLNIKVKNAMTYPIILAVLTVGCVLIMFLGIMPQFFVLFEDMELELPAITQAAVAFSKLLSNQWYIVLAVLVLIVPAFKALGRIEPLMFQWDKIKVRLPMVGPLLKIIYTARFARTLSSLYSTGIPMINAVGISASVINNRYLTSQFDSVTRAVRSGTSLSVAIKTVKGLDKKLVSTIFIGEETGRLDTMLRAIASSFEYESDMAMTKMTTFIEPVMIVILAVVVGGTAVAIMLPIITMYGAIGV